MSVTQFPHTNSPTLETLRDRCITGTTVSTERWKSYHRDKVGPVFSSLFLFSPYSMTQPKGKFLERTFGVGVEREGGVTGLEVAHQ